MIDPINSPRNDGVFPIQSPPVQADVEKPAAALLRDPSWRSPLEIAQGGVKCLILAMKVKSARRSLYELHRAFQVEHSAAIRFKRIVSAVKESFVDLVELAGSSADIMNWAHKVKILPLGKYAPLIKGLSPGCSLISSGVGAGAEIYHVYTHSEAAKLALAKRNELERHMHEELQKCSNSNRMDADAMISAGSQSVEFALAARFAFAEKEEHEQRIYVALMRLTGRVAMIAWAPLVLRKSHLPLPTARLC